MTGYPVIILTQRLLQLPGLFLLYRQLVKPEKSYGSSRNVEVFAQGNAVIQGERTGVKYELCDPRVAYTQVFHQVGFRKPVAGKYICKGLYIPVSYLQAYGQARHLPPLFVLLVAGYFCHAAKLIETFGKEFRNSDIETF